MKILGIDPGCTESAYVLWDDESRTILEHGKLPNEDLSGAMQTCERVVIEMVSSYGMPVGKEVFETVFWIGRFYEQSYWYSAEPDRIFRHEVKSSLCFSTKANDSAIRQRVIDLLGPPGTKKAPGVTYGLSGDEWQALALILAWKNIRSQQPVFV